MPIRQVKAFTVRFDFPSSRTKKIRPLANEIKMTSMVIKTMVLVNICYTLAEYLYGRKSMFSLTVFNVSFTPRWRMSLLAFLAIALLIGLGCWQLQRATEKNNMLAAYHQLVKQAPVPWKPTNQLPAQYQPVMVQGHFMPDVILLDNQHNDHQFGYHVISPFLVGIAKGDNQKIILVDRGWVVADVTRQTLPATDTPTGFIHLTGTVYYPSEKNWLLGPVIEKEQAGVVVVELINTQLIGQFLHKSVYPFIIRLGEHEAGGYIRNWAVVAMPPERHYAYALQWFVMALIGFILFIALNTTTKK